MSVGAVWAMRGRETSEVLLIAAILNSFSNSSSLSFDISKLSPVGQLFGSKAEMIMFPAIG